MSSFGAILILIGIIIIALGIVSSAKLEFEELGMALTASAGVVLIVLGVFFHYMGV